MLAGELGVAVVGAGVVGLAVTDALARRGVDAACFEAGVVGDAQSGGLTRTFRHRHDDERLVELAVRARRGWQGWERRCGRRLLGSEGVAYAGASDEDAARLERGGVACRFVPGDDLPSVFGLAAPTRRPVLFDESGGAIRVRRTVDALLSWVGERVIAAEVLGISAPGGDERPQLHTAHGLYRARHVVICAGAGSQRLAAGVGIDLPIGHFLHARPTFRIRAGYRDTRLTCWVDQTGEHGEDVYGSPVGTSGRFAIGLSGTDQSLPLYGDGRIPQGADMTGYVDRVARYVRRALPGLDPEPESVRLCVSTHLPRYGDAFSIWQAGSVTAFAGANLFKFAAVLGELLADVAVDGTVAPVLTANP